MIPSCEHVGPMIEAFRDGLLEGRDRDMVANHLESCPACAADELGGQLAMDVLFPKHVVDASAMARDGEWRRAPVRLAEPSRVWRGVFAAAATSAAAAAAVVLFVPGTHGPAPTTYGMGSGASGSTVPAVKHVDAKVGDVGIEIFSAGNVTLQTTAGDTAPPASSSPARH